jgi:hypothetical protein
MAKAKRSEQPPYKNLLRLSDEQVDEIQRKQAKRLDLNSHYKSAERMMYEHPINKQALKDISFKKP